MGEVYRAHDPRLGREIAIKVLPAAFAADRERLHRFEQEARAAAALNHPNIVTFHSVEEVNGIRFLTMELLEGQPLSDLIPPGGLPLDRLLGVAIPLSDALAAAHAKGITHRDLKPANVMVGADRRVTVLDFGLAKLHETSPVASWATALPTVDMTGEGRIVGTVAYMSPEQAEGKPIDHRSDLFSLGVILYELATGRRPFTGETSVSIISSILKDTPPSFADLNATLPRELGRIVRRALTKDRERRYQTAKDLRNELEDLKQEIESRPAAPDIAPRPVERAASIAVLAFADMSAAKDQDWFCDGIAEEILNASDASSVPSRAVLSRITRPCRQRSRSFGVHDEDREDPVDSTNTATSYSR
jgi:non-specific serine/threonine protein kinase